MINIKSKNNEVGDMYSIDLENTTIYNIFTKAGNYRGGKSYSNDKKVIIISGLVKVISLLGNSEKEEFYKSGDIFVIDANTPHIFYFEEDSEIIEYFPKNTKTEKNNKFYDLKNQ